MSRAVCRWCLMSDHVTEDCPTHEDKRDPDLGPEIAELECFVELDATRQEESIGAPLFGSQQWLEEVLADIAAHRKWSWPSRP